LTTKTFDAGYSIR